VQLWNDSEIKRPCLTQTFATIEERRFAGSVKGFR
jgi:hypothetical protein